MNKTGTHGTLVRIEKNETVHLKWVSWWLGNVIWFAEILKSWKKHVDMLSSLVLVDRNQWELGMFDLVILHCVRDISLSSLLGAEPVLGSFVKSKQIKTHCNIYTISRFLWSKEANLALTSKVFALSWPLLALLQLLPVPLRAIALPALANLQSVLWALQADGWVTESREPSLSQLSQPPFRNLLIKCSCSLPLLEPGNLCSFGIYRAFVFDFWGREVSEQSLIPSFGGFAAILSFVSSALIAMKAGSGLGCALLNKGVISHGAICERPEDTLRYKLFRNLWLFFAFGVSHAACLARAHVSRICKKTNFCRIRLTRFYPNCQMRLDDFVERIQRHSTLDSLWQTCDRCKICTVCTRKRQHQCHCGLCQPTNRRF